MSDFGLVFSGGGGKGAYEIGVWKYLREIGLDKQIRAVSGTSVGALNAALFAGSDYEQAEKLWLSISQEKILTPRIITPDEVADWYRNMKRMFKKDPAGAGVQLIMGSSFVMNKFTRLMEAKIRSDYLFSRRGLRKMIQEGVDFQQLRDSEISCFVTCFDCQEMRAARFRMNGRTEKGITKLLLASSAIPVIFPNVKFKGKTYCDGGIPLLGDNIPIRPVYDAGIRNIIVVHLSRENFIDKSRFPDADIIEIFPGEDLGNSLTGTLDFTAEGSERRLQQGYIDAKKIIKI